MLSFSKKIFVINLDGSKERWLESQNQLEGFEIERVPAVDGAKLKVEELNQFYDLELNKKQYHKLLTVGEVGCYLSHRKVWQKIVDEQLDFALVLEDDFINKTDIANLMLSIAQIKLPWHCIKLAEFPVKRKVIFSENLGDENLVTYRKIPAKTCAQLISLEGAKRLLSISKRFGRPVDVDIQHWWEGKLLVFGLKPYPFMINQNINSDIENKGARKKSNTRRVFKAYQQIKFYFKNKHHTSMLLSNRKNALEEIG